MSGDDLCTILILERPTMKCEKCFAELYACPDCKGQTKTSILGDKLMR